MKKFLASLFAIALFAFTFSIPTVTKAQQTGTGKVHKHRDKVPNEYIVVFKDDLRSYEIYEKANQLSRFHGGEVLHTYNTALKGFAVRLPGNNPEAIAEAISRHPSVAYVEENGLLAPTQVPANGYYAGDYDQWGLDRIDQRYFGRDQRYFPTRTGRGVNVYVVDSGIWYSHQEFEGRAVYGFDAFSSYRVTNVPGRNGQDCGARTRNKDSQHYWR